MARFKVILSDLTKVSRQSGYPEKSVSQTPVIMSVIPSRLASTAAMIRTNDFARQQRYLAHHRLDFQSQYNVSMHFPLIAQAMTYQASDF